MRRRDLEASQIAEALSVPLVEGASRCHLVICRKLPYEYARAMVPAPARMAANIID
jgi:hypothetical protein